MSFIDKVAVVTGGASGIGAATVKALAAEGARVVAADIDSGPLKKMEEEVSEGGHSFLALRVNVAAEEDVKEMIDKTVSHFGSIDIEEGSSLPLTLALFVASLAPCPVL